MVEIRLVSGQCVITEIKQFETVEDLSKSLTPNAAMLICNPDLSINLINIETITKRK